MRKSPTCWLLLAVVPLSVVAFGCGASASAPPARVSSATGHIEATLPSAPGLRLKLNSNAGGEIESVDLLDLTADERAAFAQLDAQQQAAALNVHVVADGADLPAVTGTRAVVGDALRFAPRFAFARGMRYRLALDRGTLASTNDTAAPAIILEFTTPDAPATPPTEITHVYPSSDKLPENLLKFYIHFSAPMSRGEAYRHIHLLDNDGREVDAPFLELDEELWDPTMRRFTLLCDPGRIKRGLKPREDVGPVLAAGKDYTLAIDRDWRDAAGNNLAHARAKTFHTLPADVTPIEPALWQLAAPRAGSREPLSVRFPEPLDHALLARLLRVTTAAGEDLAGAIVIDEEETRYQFTPAGPWQPGDYRLVAGTALEDLAGNAIGRAFDVDTFGPVGEHIETDTVSIPFSIAGTETQ